MSCGCSSIKKDGKGIVDLVRSKGKADFPLSIPHEIECGCGKTFTMSKLVDNCPHCHMTYGVTPCSSSNKENVAVADINY
ncbi:MAG: hypothetical protein RR636_08615 [Clostridium sp.]|uniref:hypothetical protein n=1 Tax=Clostridium sp. TaxID=1506 RepID=UPI00305765A9